MTVTREGAVAVVEMRRPPGNFIDPELIHALAGALGDLGAGGRCRAIVLCSEGKHFCAGARFGGPDDPRSFPMPEGLALYDVALRIFEQPLPIVAAVQGAAIGGGLGLALAADFRVAAPESRFAANFARLGFHHGFGLTVTLPAAVGQQRALEMLYLGRAVSGEEAHRIGLCDRLSPAAEVRAAAVELAAAIAASAPLAVGAIRQTMRGRVTADVRAALEREKAEQLRLIETEDWREGVAAAAERRDPVFWGR